MLIPIHLKYSTINHNWWKNKFITQQLHHSNEDIISEAKVGVSIKSAISVRNASCVLQSIAYGV